MGDWFIEADVVIVGAGAAGLATAIFAATDGKNLSIALLDGAKKPGAKILISGGGRCNLTHEVVTPADYCGGSANVIRRILHALPVDATIAFFQRLGVPMHQEADGRLFPETNQASTVLAALLAEVERLGVRFVRECRVTQLDRDGDRFVLTTSNGTVSAAKVVLATGGCSLPKTGSDGLGFKLAQRLGHSLIPLVPALVPLTLEGSFHVGLSGIALPVELTLSVSGQKPSRFRGPMLWTHFGISGPVVLDLSRVWHQARLEKKPVGLTANLLPGSDFAAIDSLLLEQIQSHPRKRLLTGLATLLPTGVATAILDHLQIDPDKPMAHLAREVRRPLVNALLAWPLPVNGSRGYAHAEVTAGGVPLREVDPATLASRVCPGLYLVGEILDVDGRMGGFNFQWCWSSAAVVAAALARG